VRANKQLQCPSNERNLGEFSEAEASILLVDLVMPIRQLTFHLNQQISDPAKATLERVLKAIATATVTPTKPQEDKLHNPGARQSVEKPHVSGYVARLKDQICWFERGLKT